VLYGELVKNVTAHTRLILFILLGLTFLVPGVAHADPNSAQTTAQKEAKKSQKRYMKQQRKEQKKAMRSWKRRHPTAH